MEIDPTRAIQEMVEQCECKTHCRRCLLLNVSTADSNGMMGSMMQDLAFSIPGVDEAMSFAEIMKYIDHAFPSSRIRPFELIR